MMKFLYNQLYAESFLSKVFFCCKCAKTVQLGSTYTAYSSSPLSCYRVFTFLSSSMILSICIYYQMKQLLRFDQARDAGRIIMASRQPLKVDNQVEIQMGDMRRKILEGDKTLLKYKTRQMNVLLASRKITQQQKQLLNIIKPLSRVEQDEAFTYQSLTIKKCQQFSLIRLLINFVEQHLIELSQLQTKVDPLTLKLIKIGDKQITTFINSIITNQSIFERFDSIFIANQIYFKSQNQRICRQIAEKMSWILKKFRYRILPDAFQKLINNERLTIYQSQQQLISTQSLAVEERMQQMEQHVQFTASHNSQKFLLSYIGKKRQLFLEETVDKYQFAKINPDDLSVQDSLKKSIKQSLSALNKIPS